MALAATLLFAVGCSNNPFGADVTGSVTLDGNPVPPGVVLFVPAKPGVEPARGNIDEQGRYFLVTKKQRGVAPGDYTVAVRVFDRSGLVPGERAPLKQIPLIPTRYLDSTTAGLSYSVAAGDNQIDLTLTTNDSEG
ncbi:hypothetical protein [Botrimarina hoheduenensis]|nr:hypothetical protein [Botrimarina hoheduenensis]